MAKRGFFAEINYQAQQAEKRRAQQEAANERARAAAARNAEKAAKEAERGRIIAQRATEADRKAAEKEAARLHAEARVAQVESMNADLASTYADIDSMLEHTLSVDDFVDLETLKVTATHPPFDAQGLDQPTAQVPPPVLPERPVYQEPPAPGALAGAFGGKKRHADAVELAKAEFEEAVIGWEIETGHLEAQRTSAEEVREQREAERLDALAKAEATYRAESEQRDADAEAQNAQVTSLINNLAFDVEDAITEYVGIVLSNSVYPDAFPVSHDYTFDLATRELTLRASIPDPETLPSVKEYRYVKSKDEITSSQLSAKAQKDRYTSAVHQVAVRTLHEIFEADRVGKIHSVALTVDVERRSPATGLPEQVPLVVVASDRATFDAFDLENVVPSATLEHLGAAMSKSPFDLTPAPDSGVRQQGS